jgi:hypothetical protein
LGDDRRAELRTIVDEQADARRRRAAAYSRTVIRSRSCE